MHIFNKESPAILIFKNIKLSLQNVLLFQHRNMLFLQFHLIPLPIYQIILLFVQQVPVLVDVIGVICQNYLGFALRIVVFAHSERFHETEQNRRS